MNEYMGNDTFFAGILQLDSYNSYFMITVGEELESA